jgi:hypothetical protein
MATSACPQQLHGASNQREYDLDVVVFRSRRGRDSHRGRGYQTVRSFVPLVGYREGPDYDGVERSGGHGIEGVDVAEMDVDSGVKGVVIKREADTGEDQLS